MSKPDSLEILKEYNAWRRGRGDSAKYDGIQEQLGVTIDAVIEEVEKLRVNERASISVMRKWEAERVEMVAEINRLKVIEQAAINMCDVKGRHHSELAMNRLMEVCGRAKKCDDQG